MSRRILRTAIALLPLALAAVLVPLGVYDRIDFGGGEKDLAWVLAWGLWAVLFAASSFELWRRGWPVARAAVRSAVVATAGVVLTATLLALLGQLGVAGL